MYGQTQINIIFDIVICVTHEYFSQIRLFLCKSLIHSNTAKIKHFFPHYIHFPIKRASTLQWMAGCNVLTKLRCSKFKTFFFFFFSHLNLTLTIHIWWDGGFSVTLAFLPFIATLHSSPLCKCYFLKKTNIKLKTGGWNTCLVSTNKTLELDMDEND